MSKFLKRTLFGALSILMIISTPAYAVNNEINNGSFNQAIIQPYFTNISTF